MDNPEPIAVRIRQDDVAGIERSPFPHTFEPRLERFATKTRNQTCTFFVLS
jgi:hypothetical protein